MADFGVRFLQAVRVLKSRNRIGKIDAVLTMVESRLGVVPFVLHNSMLPDTGSRSKCRTRDLVMRVSINAAQAQLSRLVDRVIAGEEVVIVRNGRPVARLLSDDAKLKPRKLGILAGKLRVARDFDAPLPAAVLAAFEGRE